MSYPSHPLELAKWAAFREARRDAIYATDTPAILGLSKWATPVTVWRDKVEGVGPTDPMSLQAFLGLELEDTLVKLYQERYPDREPFRPDGWMAEPAMEGHPLLKTHLDFVIHEDLLLECKTRMRRTPDWGEDGSATVPVDVWVQCQHEMMVTGAAACDVAVLFGLYTFHVYHLTRDEGFIGTLVPKLEAWWDEYVVTKTPPPISAHPADEAWSKRWEQAEPGLRNATPDQEAIFRQYAMARANVAQAERAKTQLENVIRELIGPAEGIKGDFGTITYRQAKDSIKVGWQEISGVYRAMIDELLEMANPGDDDRAVMTLAAIQAQLPLVPGLYTRTEKGTRRLNVSFSEEGTGDE